MHATLLIWKSEDNFQELVSLLPLWVPGLNLGHQVVRKAQLKKKNKQQITISFCSIFLCVCCVCMYYADVHMCRCLCVLCVYVLCKCGYVCTLVCVVCVYIMQMCICVGACVCTCVYYAYMHMCGCSSETEVRTHP